MDILQLNLNKTEPDSATEDEVRFQLALVGAIACAGAGLLARFLFDAPLVPELSKKVLWRRVRIAIEFGFAADEMLNEEKLIKREDIIKEAARVLRWSLRDPE